MLTIILPYASSEDDMNDPKLCRSGPKKCGNGSVAENGNSDFGCGHFIRGNEF